MVRAKREDRASIRARIPISLTPRPDIDLPRILEYAKEKGVGIRFWVHWKPLSENLEKAFATVREVGHHAG